MQSLLAEGQGHLFAHWPQAGEKDEDKRQALAQLHHLDKNYAGGLVKYIRNAQQLLRESKEGKRSRGQSKASVWAGGSCRVRRANVLQPVTLSGPTAPAPTSHPSSCLPACLSVMLAGANPFEGCTPSVPEGEKLDFGSEEFRQFERRGVQVSALPFRGAMLRGRRCSLCSAMLCQSAARCLRVFPCAIHACSPGGSLPQCLAATRECS